MEKNGDGTKIQKNRRRRRSTQLVTTCLSSRVAGLFSRNLRKPEPFPCALPSSPVCVFAFECRRHTKRTLYVHSLSFLEDTPFLLLRIFVTLRTRFLSLLSRTRSTYPHLYPLVFLSLCVAKPSFKLVSTVLPSETLCLLRSLHFSRRFLYSPSLSAPFCQKITRNEIAIHFVHKYFGKILWRDRSIIEFQ